MEPEEDLPTLSSRLPLLLSAAKATGDYTQAAVEIASLAGVLRSSVGETLSAAAALDEAMPDECSRFEPLCALRAVQQDLSMPRPGACADARLPEKNINDARPALRAGESPLACALACSLIPGWAVALPRGPHWPSQMRVLLHNVLAVDANHAPSKGASVASIAALNALMALLRLWVSGASYSSSDHPVAVSAVAAATASHLEAAAYAPTSKPDNNDAQMTTMHGVSAGLAAGTLLKDIPLDAPSTARLLIALARCVDRAAADAKEEKEEEEAAAAATEAEEEEEEVEAALAGLTLRESSPSSACAAAVSAALPVLVGNGWPRAIDLAPSASMELTRALLACVAGEAKKGKVAATAESEEEAGEAQTTSSLLSDETRLAASLLLSQFCAHTEEEEAAAAELQQEAVEEEVVTEVEVVEAEVEAEVPCTPPSAKGRYSNRYESPATVVSSNAYRGAAPPTPPTREVVKRVEEFAAARGVMPPVGVVLPMPSVE